MMLTEQEVINKLGEAKALLQGHFQLRSGLHSNRYFQAALALQHTALAAELCAAMAAQFGDVQVDTVLSPAIGGIVVGQEVGRALGVRAIFAEKDAESNLLLRRGFKLVPGEKVLIAEDVITKGGRVQQTLELARHYGADVVGIAVLVDRSGGKASFDVPVRSLLKLTLETYEPGDCPLCRQGLAIDKPGS
jgi:orotate phosphoribosyltransferase